MGGSIGDSPKFLRLDPLTGVGNPMAFFEWLLSHSKTQPVSPFTLISLDVSGLEQLNQNHGTAAGDAALRWAALVLLEEAAAKVYRIGGDEFVGVLSEGSPESHTEAVERVCDRLMNEADLVKMLHPAASVAMIHYTGLEDISPKDVIGVIYGAFIDMKQDPDQSYKVFGAAATEPAIDLSGLIDDLVRRMVSLGSMLDKSHRLAYTDSISGLPNMHAAKYELETTFNQVESTGEPFVILLIDGDNLSRYNKAGYLAGDEMIERLGKALESELRPVDFIARWRTGDEFLVLLREASLEGALPIAERLREVVCDVSQEWIFPITISLGVAGYPEQGRTPSELLQQAERALDQAKNSGKNQVYVSDHREIITQPATPSLEF